MSIRVTNFTQLLDCPKQLIANDILAVNSDGTAITEVSPSSLIPPVIGTGTTNDIPIFTGGVPIFQDSGMSIESLSIPNPPDPLPLQANYLNLKPSLGVDQILAYVHDPNTNSDLLFLGVGAITGDADLQISNQSTAPNKNCGLSNASTGGVTYVTGDTVVLNNNNNNTVLVDQNGFGLFDGVNNNNIQSNNTGLNLNSNSASNLTLNNGLSTLQGNNYVSLSETNDGHFINLQSNGIIIASNSLKDLSLNTDGQMKMKILSSTGNAGQVLTAQGDTSCKWVTPATNNSVNCASLTVPAGGAWIPYSGAIPFNDTIAGYSGYQNQFGSNVSYDNSTHTFTVNSDGWFNVRCAQSVNTNNSLGAVTNNGRIALYSFPGLVQIGTDTDRFQSDAGLAGISLSFQLFLDIVVFLNVGQYQVWATGEPDGLLLGKNSCTFQQIA